MNASSLVIGNWKIPSTSVEGSDEYMHVGEDGRIVYFIYFDSTDKRIVPMMFWSDPPKDHEYWIRPYPQHEGWPIHMFATDSGMKVVRSEKHFNFVAVPGEELPDWFNKRLADALSRMDSRERETTEAQQAASRNRA